MAPPAPSGRALTRFGRNVTRKRALILKELIVDERTGDFCILPSSLCAERHGAVAVLRLHRAEKRNALNDPTVQGMVAFFESLPDDIRCVVIAGDGDHFSAGLDLSELKELDVREGIAHSSSWHRAFER